jgi:chemotaxis protein CheC
MLPLASSLDLRRLSALALDAFRELGNIGSGHASGALATMLGHKVDITVPEVQLRPIAELTALCPEGEDVAAVHLRLDGETKGFVSFCVPAQTAEYFIRSLTGQQLSISDPMGISVINELANIVGGAFLSAFYAMTGLNSFLTPPEYHGGSYESAFSAVASEVQPWGDYAFIIQTAFVQDETVLPCNLFFIPDPSGMVKILERMGLTNIFN